MMMILKFYIFMIIAEGIQLFVYPNAFPYEKLVLYFKL